MKIKMLILSVFLATSFCVSADTGLGKVTRDACRAVGEQVYAIADARDAGASIKDVVSVVAANGFINDEHKTLVMDNIKMIFITDSAIQKDEAKEIAEMGCIMHFAEKYGDRM